MKTSINLPMIIGMSPANSKQGLIMKASMQSQSVMTFVTLSVAIKFYQGIRKVL
jgi:hypothetical protein